MSTILSHESEIQDLAREMWQHLDKLANQGTPVGLHHWASFFAFDVVTQLCTGNPVGFIHHGEDVMGIIESISQGFWQMANAGYLPGQTWWFRNTVSQMLSKLWRCGNPFSFDAFTKWTLSTVQGRMTEKADEERQRDLLDHYFSMKEVDGSQAKLPSVLAEIGNLVGAGADTTSVGIRSVLAQLISHPEDYRRVQREVDEARAANSGVLSHTIIERLPFFSACVKEALRLHPSILWQLPREAPKSGIDICGYFIPPSATISMSPKAQCRDKAIFGDDADHWNPHRWLVDVENTESKIKEMDRYNVTVRSGSGVMGAERSLC
jgi:cytochrome P450